MIIVRSTIQYRELPEFVLLDEIPPNVHRQILSVMGQQALDITDDSISFPYNKAPGALQFLQTMGVHVQVTKRAHASNDSFMAAYEAATTENPFSRSHRVWNAQDPDNIVQTELSEFDGNIHIGSIISPARNKGNATKVMEQIIKLADKHGVRMDLEAVPFGNKQGALNTKQLHDWYAKFGFVDHEYSSEDEPIMTREPKKASTPRKKAKLITPAFNVVQRRRLERDRNTDELQTVLENARDGHLGDENAERVLRRTGLDPRKPGDAKKLQQTIEISPAPTATSALDRQIAEKLGWW